MRVNPKIFYSLVLTLLITLTLYSWYPQNALAYNKEYQTNFDRIYSDFYNSSRYSYVLNVPYSNFPYLSGLSSMYESTQDTKYLDSALGLIEGSFNRQKDLNGDGFMEWESYNGLSPLDHDNNASTPPRLSCLYTQRGIKEASRVVRIIKNESCLDKSYQDRADIIIQKIKKDIINDPNCYQRFKPGFSTVHHIVSHPAVILLNLYLAGEDNIEIKGESFKILDILTVQTNLMRSSQFDQPENDGTVFWGNTSCEEIKTDYPTCYFVNVPGVPACKDYSNHSWCQPSDVSHANDYVYATTEFYRSGITYTRNDIKSLSNTLTKKIWNQDSTQPKFRDFLDGNLEPEGGQYGAWKMGSNLAPGWISLGAFESGLRDIFSRIEPDSLNMVGYYGELTKNDVVGDCKYSNRSKEITDGVDNDCDGLIDENSSCTLPSPCPGNVVGDSCQVDMLDLLELLSQIVGHPNDNNPKYDLDGDTNVGMSDLLFLLDIISR
ncbi:hypothetical protein GW755_01080 [bacterium]|nr:hypothetical protein [bacterium]